MLWGCGLTSYVGDMMSDIIRCECCVGKKTIIGLGGIIKKCPECKGIGFIDAKKDDEKKKEKVK